LLGGFRVLRGPDGVSAKLKSIGRLEGPLCPEIRTKRMEKKKRKAKYAIQGQKETFTKEQQDEINALKKTIKEWNGKLKYQEIIDRYYN